MKLLSDTAWIAAFRAWRGQRRLQHDPAEMGTAFGLDSITVIDFDHSTSAVEKAGAAPAASDWHRRVARRSRL